MITILYSFGRVVGAELMLIGFLGCSLLYLTLCLLQKHNRTKKGLLLTGLGWLLAELICDVFWFMLYFPDGEYVNHGIGGAYAVVVWPFLLLIAGVAVAACNSSN